MRSRVAPHGHTAGSGRQGASDLAACAHPLSLFFFFLMDLESVLILTILFIYLFLAGLGLHGCMGLSLVAESWKHPPAAAYRLLTAAASLTVGHEL